MKDSRTTNANLLHLPELCWNESLTSGSVIMLTIMPTKEVSE